MAGEMDVSNEDWRALIKAKMKVSLKNKDDLDLTISKQLGIWEF
jgi:hypothetical protein